MNIHRVFFILKFEVFLYVWSLLMSGAQSNF